MPFAISSVIALLGIGWVGYVWHGHWAETSPSVRIATVVVVAAALAAIALGRGAFVRARVALASIMLLTAATFSASRVVGMWPFTWDALADRRYAAFITVVAVGTVIGLAFRKLWARWVGLAFAGAGFVGGVLNGINNYTRHDDGAWLAAIGSLGCASVIYHLSFPAVRDAFTKPESAIWTSRDPIVRLVRWSALASIGAVPMLLVYALAQPVAPETIIPALVAVPILAIGATLVLTQRVAGVFVIGLGGVLLLAQTAATFHYVPFWSKPIAGYYAAFWIPSGALAVIAMLAVIVRGRRSSN